jgi:hypothetical protein
MVVVRTFANTVEADLAASWLEASGVDSMVLADDVGGTYPMFQTTRGVRLMVRSEDEDRAKEILETSEQDPPT